MCRSGVAVLRLLTLLYVWEFRAGASWVPGGSRSSPLPGRAQLYRSPPTSKPNSPFSIHLSSSS